jgi:hypothetical protein
MHFLVYWIFYVSSLSGKSTITGTIQVTDSTVVSYVHPYGYVEWDILEARVAHNEHNQITYARFVLRHSEVFSLMEIDQEYIYQEIYCVNCSHYERILMSHDHKDGVRPTRMKDDELKRRHILRDP